MDGAFLGFLQGATETLNRHNIAIEDTPYLVKGVALASLVVARLNY